MVIAKHLAHTPEAYLDVKTDKHKDIDVDAISCALDRAQGLCLVLGCQLDGSSGDRLDDRYLASACWALEGLIQQATILLEGTAETT